jgi:hypothetical protein
VICPWIEVLAGTPVPVITSPCEIKPVTALAVIWWLDPVPVNVAKGQFAGVSAVADDIDDTEQKPSGCWLTGLCAKAGVIQRTAAAARLISLRIGWLLDAKNLPRVGVGHRRVRGLIGDHAGEFD